METRPNRLLAFFGFLPALASGLLLIPSLALAKESSSVPSSDVEGVFAQAPPEDESAGREIEVADVPAEEGEDESRRILVGLGSQVVIESPGVRRVAIGDPAVADVHVIDGNQILVTGLSHGGTSLTLWLSDGSTQSLLLEVSDEEKAAEVREAVGFLGLADEIEVRVVGRRIVIDGRVDTVERYERYQTLVRSWPQLVDLVRFDPAILVEIAERIEAALRDAKIETVEVRVVGGTIFLEGTVADEAEMGRVEAISRAIHGSSDRSGLNAR